MVVFRASKRPPTGEQIRNARIKRGLLQRDVARALNVSQSRVCQWERGLCGTKTPELIAALWELVQSVSEKKKGG